MWDDCGAGGGKECRADGGEGVEGMREGVGGGGGSGGEGGKGGERWGLWARVWTPRQVINSLAATNTCVLSWQ